jgi:transcription elongation factor GreA
MAKETFITPEGLEKLKTELEQLSSEGRREIAERIKEARGWGDLSENAEYDSAKNDQALMESRIAQMEEKIRNAVLIDTVPDTETVSIGSKVHIKDQSSGKSNSYIIVGSTEANPAEGRLSNESPVGRALLGKKRNEMVTVSLPKGTRKLKITKIDV